VLIFIPAWLQASNNRSSRF